MPESPPIFFDSHMHTPLCKHAEGHPVLYMEHGVAQGFAGILMTCHSPPPLLPADLDRSPGRQSMTQGCTVSGPTPPPAAGGPTDRRATTLGGLGEVAERLKAAVC